MPGLPRRYRRFGCPCQCFKRLFNALIYRNFEQPGFYFFCGAVADSEIIVRLKSKFHEFAHNLRLGAVLKIGYARVSTLDQNKAMQLDALRAAGCERIFEDTASGTKESRPGLDESLAFARKGDELVVWKIDRVGRSLPHLVKLMAQLRDQGIGFRSVTENIETETPGGRMVMHMFAALAEFERDLIRERTRSGLQAARADELAAVSHLH